MAKKINIVSISDIHLGHGQVKAEFIIANLNAVLPDSDAMAEIDIIFLAGDVFDQLLHFSDEHIDAIQHWMVRLLRLCVKWDIVLRVLEGTPSHDRGQSKRFVTLNEMFDIKADILYVDKLWIENNERFDISILYIPDEYHSDPAITLQEVRDMLLRKKMNCVDYAIMHGMFEHQCPTGISLMTHNADAYLSLVRKYIFIGHVHQMSQYDRILSQGSFDRLAHGEEEEKGFWKVTSFHNSTENDRLVFEINKGAKVFKTINVVGLTKTDTEKAFRVLKDLPDHSYIRVLIEKGSKQLPVVESIIKTYPLIRWSFKHATEKESTAPVAEIMPSNFQPTPINPNTIKELVYSRLLKQGESKETADAVSAVMDSII